MGAARAVDGHGMPCPYLLAASGVESRHGGYASVLRTARLRCFAPAGSVLLPCRDFLFEDHTALFPDHIERGLHSRRGWRSDRRVCLDGGESATGTYHYARCRRNTSPAGCWHGAAREERKKSEPAGRALYPAGNGNRQRARCCVLEEARLSYRSGFKTLLSATPGRLRDAQKVARHWHIGAGAKGNLNPMPLYQAIILALVQAFTEFLPISSTAHLTLFPWLLGWTDPGLAFDVALHAGTLVAVLLYFFKDWLTLALCGLGMKYPAKAPAEEVAQHKKLFWYMEIGTIPGGLLGALFEKTIEERFRTPYVIALSLILVALVMWWADSKSRLTRPIEQSNIADAV